MYADFKYLESNNDIFVVNSYILEINKIQITAKYRLQNSVKPAIVMSLLGFKENDKLIKKTLVFKRVTLANRMHVNLRGY